MQSTRKIIHIDMDAFYASVEQRDNPALKGKPVIVGGDPHKRGVVAACSYEARKFGIHSAMASSKAFRLCPDAVFIQPRFDVYQAVSAQIRKIFHDYTDLVEPLSLDEAFLDVTENKKGLQSATLVAREIRRRIHEQTGLTASAGVSFNKFLAKVASDSKKPDGITVVTPKQADAFIAGLPIRKFFGVGKVTEQKMIAMGIKNGADLKKADLAALLRTFGKAGEYYYAIAHGEDNRPVNPHRIRKSIGKETTLTEDIDDRDRMIKILEQLATRVAYLLEKYKLKGQTITLKIKYFNFQNITRSITVGEPVESAAVMMQHLKELLHRTDAGPKKVRLLGISLSNFTVNNPKGKNKKSRQLLLPF